MRSHAASEVASTRFAAAAARKKPASASPFSFMMRSFHTKPTSGGDGEMPSPPITSFMSISRVKPLASSRAA